MAYDKAASAMYGSFARLNFPLNGNDANDNINGVGAGAASNNTSKESSKDSSGSSVASPPAPPPPPLPPAAAANKGRSSYLLGLTIYRSFAILI